MLNRPQYLVSMKEAICFNGHNFQEVEIDLKHINKLGRSKFSKNKALIILKEGIDDKFFEMASERKFGEEICTYYVILSNFEDDAYKIVMCICSDKPQTIGLITLFRI